MAHHPLSDPQPVPFTGKYSSHTTQVFESRDWENEELSSIEDQVQIPWDLMEVDPWALRELGKEVAKPLAIVFDKLW